MTRLRIWSWLFIFASPLLIALYKLIEAQFQAPAPRCTGMGCLGQGIAEFLMIALIYLVFLLIGIILNLIDFIKIRRAASAWRKFEIIVFTAPIWLWVFAIPKLFNNIIEQGKVDKLAPYIEILENYETANYDDLKVAISKVTEADYDTKYYFSNVNFYLDDAERRLKQIDFVNHNKQIKFPSDFALPPFKICIRDMEFAKSNSAWRMTYFKDATAFHELSVLADSEPLIFGTTDKFGCSNVNDTSPLSRILQQGKTLFVVVSTRVFYIGVNLSDQTLIVEHTLSSNRYQIDIQPYP